ncbi:MAG TPA: PRC-barrel domain-containing protein [Anaerolineales bacterium]|nr:PRC-barrel domain-containing protein [Anaerolineales bacterium]
MELKEGTSVFTPGGEEVGKVNRFVVDPATNEVTHIVIQKGWLLPEDKVVPFEMVNTATEERVVLSEEVGDFDSLPPFEERQFVRAAEDEPGDATPTADPKYQYTPAYYWYPAQSNIGFPGIALGHYAWPSGEKKRNIPEDTIPLREGTNIMSSNGESVGSVERLFLEEGSNKVTHFVISQGVLFKDRKLVPAHWVKSVDEDAVSLAVSSKLLEGLPSYEE